MSGSAGGSKSGIIGISRITIRGVVVIDTGEIDRVVMVRIEDINTTCMDSFIGERIVQLLSFCVI